MKKLSSYQKLKEENAKLKEDIYNLVRKEHELIGIYTKFNYELLYDFEDAVMLGSRETIPIKIEKQTNC